MKKITRNNKIITLRIEFDKTNFKILEFKY